MKRIIKLILCTFLICCITTIKKEDFVPGPPVFCFDNERVWKTQLFTQDTSTLTKTTGNFITFLCKLTQILKKLHLQSGWMVDQDVPVWLGTCSKWDHTLWETHTNLVKTWSRMSTDGTELPTCCSSSLQEELVFRLTPTLKSITMTDKLLMTVL